MQQVRDALEQIANAQRILCGELEYDSRLIGACSACLEDFTAIDSTCELQQRQLHISDIIDESPGEIVASLPEDRKDILMIALTEFIRAGIASATIALYGNEVEAELIRQVSESTGFKWN